MLASAAVAQTGCPGTRASTGRLPPAPQPAWAVAIESAGFVAGQAAASAADGSVVLGATFEEAAALAELSFVGHGSTDALFARLDGAGRPVWTQHLGGAGAASASAVAAGDGLVFAAASFAGETRVAERAIRGAGQPASVILGLDGGTGEPRWERVISASHYARISGVAAHGDEVVVAGLFAGTMRLGDVVLTSAGHQDAFVARLSADGRVLWAVRAGGPLLDAAHAVAVGEHGIAIAGTFTVRADFLGHSLAGDERSQDGFVAALTHEGRIRWISRLGGPGPDGAYAVAVGADGRVFAGGTFAATAEVGGKDLRSRGSLDAFAAAWSAEGKPVWSQRLGGAGADELHRLALDASGTTLVAAGSFAGTAPMGPSDLESAGGHDIFLVGFDAASGAPRWSRRIGGAGQDSVQALASTRDGALAIAGSFSDTLELGVARLTSRGPVNGFVARLRP